VRGGARSVAVPTKCASRWNHVSKTASVTSTHGASLACGSGVATPAGAGGDVHCDHHGADGGRTTRHRSLGTRHQHPHPHLHLSHASWLTRQQHHNEWRRAHAAHTYSTESSWCARLSGNAHGTKAQHKHRRITPIPSHPIQVDHIDQPHPHTGGEQSTVHSERHGSCATYIVIVVSLADTKGHQSPQVPFTVRRKLGQRRYWRHKAACIQGVQQSSFALGCNATHASHRSKDVRQQTHPARDRAPAPVHCTAAQVAERAAQGGMPRCSAKMQWLKTRGVLWWWWYGSCGSDQTDSFHAVDWHQAQQRGRQTHLGV